MAMSKPESKPSEADAPTDDSERFDRLTRALFGVDRRDVEKHEPIKRENEEEPLPN